VDSIRLLIPLWLRKLERCWFKTDEMNKIDVEYHRTRADSWKLECDLAVQSGKDWKYLADWTQIELDEARCWARYFYATLKNNDLLCKVCGFPTELVARNTWCSKCRRWDECDYS